MGSQVAILGTTDDLLELLAAAHEQGGRAVPEFIPADKTPELADSQELLRSHPNDKLYLLPADLAGVEIFTIEGSSDELERVNETTSPVVELVPTRTKGRTMRAGRLYLGMSPSDSRFGHAKRLYDTLKKATDSWARAEPGAVRIGPRAATQSREHGCALESLIGERLALAGTKKP